MPSTSPYGQLAWGLVPVPAEVPIWAGVVVSFLQLSQSVIAERRLRRVQDVATKIATESGLDDDEISDRLNEDALALEVVEGALEAGQRTENEEKRRLLALVAARALLGVRSERADYWRTLMRTVAEIEPIDVHLLACLRRDEETNNGPIPGESVNGWSGDTVLLEPSLGALQRTGLVRLRPLVNGMGTSVTRYGHHFLEFLVSDAGSAEYFA